VSPGRERDILVAANEYAYVQDLTKGDIVLYVGPTKISLSNTERIVELRGDRFVPVRADDVSFGVSAFVSASSSQYIVLDNPAARRVSTQESESKPIRGSNATIELLVGRRVVVAGPATFPLWPGQRARVIDGHRLREDEYVIVRYYDNVENDPHPIGSEIVVRGSDVSFYVPRTGLEVVSAPHAEVASGADPYVRKAWRFPTPGGLHVRVTKPLTVVEGESLTPGTYAAGTDLFLADRDGFFFPSEHVEVLGVVLPVPIAEKEAIYVRDLATGHVATVAGPCNYLPDPTREQIVVRKLDPERAELYAIAEDDSRAPSIYVPSSYAVLVSGKTKREVVVGPQTRILDYDEELEVLRLSTGRPKNDATPLATCFLQVDGNKVSDVVRVKTADHVELELSLSYRVSFVERGGPRERWFHVNDYVGLLCDHLGSILRGAARGVSIETFYAGSTELLRAAVLGEKKDGPRAGRLFEENAMWVYDVEVLDVVILDPDVKKLLTDAQRAAIVGDVSRREEERRLTGERLRADVDRQIALAQVVALSSAAELEDARADVSKRRATAVLELDRIERTTRAQTTAHALSVAREAEARAAERDAEIERQALEARTAAFERQMAAVAPELVATLKTLGHQQLAAELSKNVGPLAVLGGGSVSEIVERLLGALPVGTASTVVETVRTNGKSHKSA
jgi:major vault protein